MLSETFWLMSFFESACLIGSQVFSNWIIGNNAERSLASHSTAGIFLAVICLVCLTRGWKEIPHKVALKEYMASFRAYIVGGKSCTPFLAFILHLLFVYLSILYCLNTCSLKINQFLNESEWCSSRNSEAC